MATDNSYSDPSPEAPRGLGGWLAAQVRAHIRPVLLVIVPALLITALSPAGEGLRELLFPTRVSVTGTLDLPQGNFPNLRVVLDETTRVPPNPSGAFVFDGVSKGDHSIAVDSSGLSSQGVSFTVGSRSDDIDLGEVKIEPGIRLVGEIALLGTSLGVDAVLWVEASPAEFQEIKKVDYITRSLVTTEQETAPIRREAFCTHYVLLGISAAGWVPTARANFSDGGYLVVRFEAPSTPTPSCSTLVTTPPADSGTSSTPDGGGTGTESAMVVVPPLVGLSKELALQVLGGWGFHAAVVTQSSDQPANTVVAQDPAAGTEVKRGSKVTITVAEGVEETVTEITCIPSAEAGADVKILVGGQVTWVNGSKSEQMNLSFNNPPPQFEARSIKAGGNSTVVFSEPGMFEYICEFTQAKVKQVGSVTVGAP